MDPKTFFLTSIANNEAGYTDKVCLRCSNGL